MGYHYYDMTLMTSAYITIENMPHRALDTLDDTKRGIVIYMIDRKAFSPTRTQTLPQIVTQSDVYLSESQTWRHLRKMQEDGIVAHAGRGRGYYLNLKVA